MLPLLLHVDVLPSGAAGDVHAGSPQSLASSLTPNSSGTDTSYLTMVPSGAPTIPESYRQDHQMHEEIVEREINA